MKKFIKELTPYVVIVIVVILTRSFIATPVRVLGPSMNPNLENGDILLLEKYDKDYDRFDIVVFDYQKDKLIKRVVGLPGETVEYKDDNLYINGELVYEEFVAVKTSDFKLSEIGVSVIPTNHYFLVGDNRNDSLDSRVFGLVSEEDILGTVGFSIFPFRKLENY